MLHLFEVKLALALSASFMPIEVMQKEKMS